MRLLTPTLFLCVFIAAACARLGDTQDMAEARYGLPKKRIATGQPLLSGAKELTFEYQGWRIQCALLGATDGREYVVREEYSKMVNSDMVRVGGSPIIQDFEREAVLKGEAGSGSWTAKLLGNAGKDLASSLSNQFAHLSGLSGTVWVRDDGAVARVPIGGLSVVFDLPQALKYEAEVKAIKEQKVRDAVPKF